jgi:hypothetical protein
MHAWEALPPEALKSVGLLSTAMLTCGITDFRAAGRYLQGLPYGKTADRADFRSVLREGKGTCSTKLEEVWQIVGSMYRRTGEVTSLRLQPINGLTMWSGQSHRLPIVG